MIVCVCRRVSDRDIEREARSGCPSFDALQDELHVGTACGACVDCARKTFDAHCGARHSSARPPVFVARADRPLVSGALV
jgi:bacterioferritin-associated ferredoxin